MQSGDEVPVPQREDREICDGMSVTLNRKNFPIRQLKTGWLDLRQDIVVRVPENVDAIHSIILAERRISAKNIAETGNILGMCRVHRP
jgi:hypothetical protein